MNREEAEKALDIVRQVISNTRDDLVSHNWGLIWMIHAFTDCAAFCCIGALVEAKGLALVWYFVPLACLMVLNFAILLALMHRDHGVRSFVEFQLHGIWTSFVVFSLAGAAVLVLAKADARLLCPIMAICSGIGFSMMGIMFRREFLGYAGLFLAAALITPLAQPIQWYLLGAVWWVSLFLPGLRMHREKQLRSKESRARIL